MYAMIKITPTILVISFRRNMNIRSITAVIRVIKPSRLSSSLFTIYNLQQLWIFPIPAMFHIFDPITTPTPISGFPDKSLPIQTQEVMFQLQKP